jgi:hypothetical protein
MVGRLKYLCFLYLIGTLLGVANPASAAIVITNITGASAFTLAQPTPTASGSTTTTTTTTGTTQIFGGIGGDACTTSGVTSNTDGTCNNCPLASYDSPICNQRRIDPTATTLVITFYSTTIANAGTPLLLDANSLVLPNSGPSVNGANQSTYVSVPWSQICGSAVSGDSTCSANGQGELTIGLDGNQNNILTDSTDDSTTITLTIYGPSTSTDQTQVDCSTATGTAGICNWQAFPGDQRIYLINPVPAPNFPNAADTGSNVTLLMSGLQLFYATTGFADVSTASPSSSFSLSTNSTTSTTGTTTSNSVTVTPDHADGFTNDIYYFFRLATVDQAQNVAFLTDNEAIETVCGSGSSTLTSDQVAANAQQILTTCPYIAEPDQVVGLLTKDFNCFIASASYGSSLDRHLDTFRRFRSLMLLRSEWGRRFNKFYYRYGPYGARILNAHPTLKPLARIVLWPAWFFADLSLKHGMALAALVVMGSLSLVLGGFLFFLPPFLRRLLTGRRADLRQ